MVYLRKSISKMAAAAAAAAQKHCSGDAGIDPMDVALDAAVAVHTAIPAEAPARAAVAAKIAKASGAACTAIAAGVAAAAVGLKFEDTQTAAEAVFDAAKNDFDSFSADSDPPVVVDALVESVVKAVNGVSPGYPVVGADVAAVATYLAYSLYFPVYSCGGPPEQGGGVDAVAIAAANAAGATARAFKGPVGCFYVASAAVASVTAATVWGGSQRAVVVAAIKAATFTDAQPPTDMSQLEEHAEYVQHVAATFAEASSASDSAVACSTGACGVEKLEALSYDHMRTYEGLQTIMAFGTFLAGFLLTSLSGKLDEEEQELEAEVAQIVFQTLSFGLFLASTVCAGALMLRTGGKRALSEGDLRVPLQLSVSGLLMVIVTTGNWAYLALGFKSDNSISWYIWSIVIGLAVIVWPILNDIVTTRVGRLFSGHLRKYRRVEA